MTTTINHTGGEVSQLKPIEARTWDEVCSLPRDNFPASSRVWTLMLSPESHEVHLHGPAGSKESVAIPRDEWDVMVKWYMGVVP